MIHRFRFAAAILLVCSANALSLWAAEGDGELPPGDRTPILRLETGGPRSFISSLAFSPDGKFLYVAGWDKLVQVWNRGKQGTYEYNSAAGLRIPVGSGLYGGISAMAVSEDGTWVAVGGLGHARDLSGEHRTGWIVPAGMRTDSALLDEGMIYVFNLNLVTRDTTLLRGHRGSIQNLAFVSGGPTTNEDGVPIPPSLVSIAEEPTIDQVTKPEIRLWSVQNATMLAKLTKFPNGVAEAPGDIDLPGFHGFRPGLTAWTTGPTAKHVRVAIAWGDQKLRVWDVQTEKIAYGAGNDLLLTVLPLSKNNDRLLTGAHGSIGVWTLPAFAPGRLDPQIYKPADVPEVNGKEFHLPRAAIISRDAEGNPETVAVVVTQHLVDDQRRETGRAKYRLLILSAVEPVKTIREIQLWEGSIRQPGLAITRDGQTLAVSGNSRNEIQIHQVKELLAGNPPNPQIITSRGTQFKDAAFVRDGNRWGIQLSETPRDKSSDKFPDGSLVLDISGRRVDKLTDNWRFAGALDNGWTSAVPQRDVMTVTRPNLPALSLKLEQDFVAVSFAFCPPSNVCPIPLVAVASHQQGQPLLQIFHGETGAPLRWCEGHTERIRSLSFSDDGRMLLSVADDRTVVVWTVTDLVDKVLNKRGRIPDLIVRVREDRLAVIEPGTSPLLKDDVVQGISRKGKKTIPKTAKEFYRVVLDCIPGDQVEVTVRRNGAVRNIECRVEQAIDEGKPLFSLFVAPNELGNVWEWIGWHPLGNFDFGGDRVERQLGWHFNTDDPQRPVRFAPVGDYREKFVKPNLLQGLIANQKLEQADVAAVAPRMKFSLRYQEDNVFSDENDVIRMRIKSRQVDLVADVIGIPDDRIREMSVSIDSKAPIKFSLTPNQEWIAELSGFTWERGAHNLVAKLSTSDGESIHKQPALFRPQPPLITWGTQSNDEVTENTLKLSAAIKTMGEPAHVELTTYSSAKERQLVKAWDFAASEKPQPIEQNVDLGPGENFIRIDSWNTAPGRPGERFEHEFKVIPVNRTSSPLTPRISELKVLFDQNNVKAELEPNDQYVYRSSVPVVWITGSIESAAKIDGLQMKVGDANQELPEFTPGKAMRFALHQQLTLRPGEREKISIIAKSGDLALERRLEIEYVPDQPSIAAVRVNPVSIVRPVPSNVPRVPNQFFSGYESNRCLVTAVLDGAFDKACQVEIFVNDKSQGVLPIDPGQTEVTSEVTLENGASIIDCRVKATGPNPQKLDEKSRAVTVTYKQPPVVHMPNASAEVMPGQSFVVICEAESASPIQAATITANDQAYPMTVLQIPAKPNQWLLNYGGVLKLSKGKHLLQITAVNGDGASLEPATHEVNSSQPAARPVLEFLNPAPPSTSDPVHEFEYKVNCTKPANFMIDVRCSTGKVDQPDAFALPENSGDDQPVKGRVRLGEGPNVITLTAFSETGSSEKRVLNISYVAPPIMIEIVNIDGRVPDFELNWSGNEKELRLKSKMAKNVTPIQGRVSSKESLVDKAPLYAHIWVNSFKLPTVPAVVDPKDPKKATFASNISFSRKYNNLIKVGIMGREGPQPVDLGNTGAMLVDCEDPVRDQTLYLVLLGTGSAREKEEQTQKFLAVNKVIQKSQPKVWRSASFSEIYVLNAMNENIPHVQGVVSRLQNMMDNKHKSFPEVGSNTIVMVLFQGQMRVRTSEFHLITDEFPQGRTPEFNDLLSGKLLERQMTKTYGAHLLLMDLQQNTVAKETIWPQAPHLGMLIANWNSIVKRPDGSRLLSDLRSKYVELRQVAENFRKIESIYPGQIEILDRLHNHYELRFGTVE